MSPVPEGDTDARAGWLARPSRYAVFLAVSFVVAGAVVFAARAVLLPFVLAVVIAYLLTPLVRSVERRRVPRAAAIILVYVLVLGTIGLFVRSIAPRVGHELGALRRELPSLATRVRTSWVPLAQSKLREAGLGGPPPPLVADAPVEEAPAPAFVARQRPDGSFAVELSGPIAIAKGPTGGYVVEPAHEARADVFDVDRMVSELAGKTLSYAQHNALEVVKLGRDVVRGVSRVIFIFGITLMLAAYMMLTRERIAGFFLSLARPTLRPWLRELGHHIDLGLSGVVRGQLVICVVNGVLSAIGFAIVGLKYWPVLALLATVLSLIPIFGSIISTIPAVALGLTQSVGTAAFVLVWILGIHQLEANVLNPKIMGDAAKIHPVLVIFALLVGEHFFGVLGALLAVPCMSIAQSVFLHVRDTLRPVPFA